MPGHIKLVVGLGNPEPGHSGTRHNAGFWFLDRLAKVYNCSFSADSKFFGDVARIQSGGVDCRLLKPLTFMNESGRAVRAILDYYRIAPGEVLVVHDEIDIEPGTVRLKLGGGHAGHNGVRDIINNIGSRDFNRLRIGVGHPGVKEKVIGSVLGKPSGEDKQLIDEAIDKALELMPMIFRGEFSKAMTELHSSNKQQATSNKDENDT